jgi:hypothetical protein
MGKRYVFEVASHDEAEVDALVAYNDRGGVVFIKIFAGDAVSIYFVDDEGVDDQVL